MSLFKRALQVLGSDLPGLFLAVVLLVVSADVFIRTVLRQSFHVAHDLAILAFAGVVWFGVVGAALKSELFGVRFFVDRLPPGPRRFMQALVHLLVIAIAAAVVRAAIAQVQTARFTTFLALGWPKWIVSAALGLAMLAVIAIQLIQLYEMWRRDSR